MWIVITALNTLCSVCTWLTMYIQHMTHQYIMYC